MPAAATASMACLVKRDRRESKLTFMGVARMLSSLTHAHRRFVR
jgi:hypothetical protein